MSYTSDWERGITLGQAIEEAKSQPEPVMGQEQQEYLARAAAEAMANLAILLPPILAQFQLLAQTALPALRKAIEPFALALKEAGVDADTAVAEMKRLRAEEDR